MRIAIVSLIAFGCAVPADPIASSTHPIDTAAWPPPKLPAWDASALGGDRDAVDRLAGEARALVVSPPFAKHMAALSGIELRPDTAPIEGAAVASVYLGYGPHRQLPTRYVRACQPKKETADTGIDEGGATATTCLQAVTVERARCVDARGEKATIEARACAIDTIAHEWSHTIPDGDGSRSWLIEDGGHSGETTPLASYVIGAVAHCAYLEQHGYAMSEVEFRACVDAAGTNMLGQVCTREELCKAMDARLRAAGAPAFACPERTPAACP